uniref:Far upstream element-binding protein 1 n=2 Tax=Steinernema glaseri TaxID=37863 RepID=A0A1I7ZYF1_9BILA
MALRSITSHIQSVYSALLLVINHSNMASLSNDSINEALQRAKELAAGSLKRQHDDDDESNLHYPAKRQNVSMDMSRTAAGAGDGNVSVDVIDVPDNCVGLVIGRGGEQISQIQSASGCRVQMAGESNASGQRQCTLQGNKASVEKAREMIMEVINRAGNRPPPNRNGFADGGVQNGGGPRASGGAVGQSTIEIMIPGPKCGLIIGKSGETIKAIQEQAGVKMLLIQDNSESTGAPKPLRISGDENKVHIAKRMVEEIMASREETTAKYTMYQPRSIGEVIVPRASVGMIIGKGGETIKRLGNESGAKIQFKPDDDPTAPDRCAVIQGTPDQITRATNLISELVNKSGSGAQSEVFYMHVPANKTGLVIGKGGETIKQICSESGAHVELSRDPPPNASEKVFILKGTAYQIHHAQHIIRIKVGDVAPGTPVPQFGGPGGPAAGDVFAGQGYEQMGGSSGAQWNNNFTGQGGQEWSQYYNQQGQQGGAQGGQFQQQQQPSAQYQQSSSSPAINPQTGQPDYSAQWAEYYRSMGMHEQAQMIEQQLKQGGPAAQPTGGQRQQAYGAGYGHF